MSSIRDQVKLEALNLAVGEHSGHISCPQCGGGSSREKSFVLTRTTEGVLYKCHRNSCGARGFVPSRPGKAVLRREKEPYPFRGTTRNLEDREYQFFKDRFELDREDVNSFKWSEDKQRVIMPCYTGMGYEWGCVARGYEELGEYGGPKAITYYDNPDYPLISFYGQGEDAVMVEDVISAIKINKATGLRTIALLGTHITEEGVVRVIGAGVSNLTIWLDGDAVNKAMNINWMYGLSFRSCGVFMSEYGSPDPKDRPLKELKQILEG